MGERKETARRASQLCTVISSCWDLNAKVSTTPGWELKQQQFSGCSKHMPRSVTRPTPALALVLPHSRKFSPDPWIPFLTSDISSEGSGTWPRTLLLILGSDSWLLMPAPTNRLSTPALGMTTQVVVTDKGLELGHSGRVLGCMAIEIRRESGERETEHFNKGIKEATSREKKRNPEIPGTGKFFVWCKQGNVLKEIRKSLRI